MFERRVLRPKCLALWLILPLLSALAPDAAAQTTLAQTPRRQKSFANLFPAAHTSQSSPRIDSGYLLSFERVTTNGRQKNIFLEALAGNGQRQISFWPDGASSVWINDVAVTSDRYVIVVGSTARAGATNYFFSKVGLAGQLINTIDLGSYEPEQVCAAGNDTIWMLGQVWEDEETGSSYSMLRSYASNGELLGSYLERRNLQIGTLNISDRHNDIGRLPGRTFLRCGQESVGVYIGQASVWMEVRIGDGVEQRWSVKPISRGTPITGLALLGQHKVYASFKNSTLLGNFSILNLDNGTQAIWQPVADPLVSVLIGSDGPSLVYLQAGTISLDGSSVLFWKKP